MSREIKPAKPIRRRSNGVRTRGDIVAAAERHFAENGFAATRLDDIAGDVGIRRAAIFYHFGDKQELYAAMLHELFGDLEAPLPTTGSAIERLEAALTGWIDLVAERPSIARLMLREAANTQPGKVTPFIEAGRGLGDWFRAAIAEGVASGEFRPRIEPYRFLSLMAGTTIFHFAAMPWLALDQPVDPWGHSELDKLKEEILHVARDMLGIPTPSTEPA